jgi:hypothetical protein
MNATSLAQLQANHQAWPGFCFFKLQLMMTIVRTLILSALVFCGLTAMRPQAFGQGGVPIWTNRNQAGGHVALDRTGNLLLLGGTQWGSTLRLTRKTVVT